MTQKKETTLDDVMEALTHIMNFSEKNFQAIREDIQGVKRKLEKLDNAVEIIQLRTENKELRSEKEKDLSHIRFSELEQRIRAVELKVAA